MAHWWVGSTDQKNDANMELVQITRNEIEVPVYTNMVDIMPTTRLMKYREKKAQTAAVQLQGATIISGGHAPPKKRRKK